MINIDVESLAVQGSIFFGLMVFNYSVVPFLYARVTGFLFKTALIQSDNFSELGSQIKDYKDTLSKVMKKYVYMKELNVDKYSCLKRFMIRLKVYYVEKNIVELSTKLSLDRGIQETIIDVYNDTIKRAETLMALDGDIENLPETNSDLFVPANGTHHYGDTFKKWIGGWLGKSPSVSNDLEESLLTHDNIIELIIDDTK